MSYKKLITMDVAEILRRRSQGQSISEISRALGYDRKTVRKYLSNLAKEAATVLPDNEQIRQSIGVSPGRPKDKQDILLQYKTEIKQLVENPGNPLKAKSAFEIICLRHNLQDKVSYSSFKRFIRKSRIGKTKPSSTCRIEYQPGNEIQIDYCKAGLLYDKASGKKKVVYAFIGTLSFSRHKYVEFVYTQNQKSFVQSHINMFRFFQGVTSTIKLDNLKSGVIKPDLYDPKLNRSFLELSEHYGFFIDPCRVASPKDKGIVERDVQTIREEFRKMIAINPMITLAEANCLIKDWTINVYGTRKHGTTRQAPMDLFTNVERPLLLSLPFDEYEVADWKTAIVHPDHYIQVNKKAYSMPEEYIGCEVLVKVNERTISIYFKDELVKLHTVPNGYRQTDMNDFPDNQCHRLDTGMPAYLINQALMISPNFQKLITKLLSKNAYLNLRRAQAMVKTARNYTPEQVELASKTALENYSSVHPALFKSIIDKHAELLHQETELVLSMETESYVREADYFTHHSSS